jgi:carboxyl-terminal processing protease
VLDVKPRAIVAVLLLCICANRAAAQPRFDRRAAEAALDHIHKDLKRLYYDSTFGGIDMDEHMRRTRASFQDDKSEARLITALANYLKPLRDSHTYFVPPGYEEEFSYGFRIKFFGEAPMIVDVAPGSDAERQGLARGDRVNLIDGHALERSTYSDLMYEYYTLAPRKSVQLVVTTVDGRARQLTVKTAIKKGLSLSDQLGWAGYRRAREAQDSLRRHYAHRYAVLEKRVLVWRMPGFWDDDAAVGDILDEAQKVETLILDLRGNPGGAVEALRDLVSRTFNFEVQIATLLSRKGDEILKAKPASKVFTRRMMVLVDSESASASEVYARLVQLFGRATVIGDRTAGAVRASKGEAHTVRGFYDFGISITRSDVEMPDGGLLEGIGVQPNEMVNPKNYDLAEGRDPVLSYALNLAGVEMDAVTAGRFYESAKKKE